jgi:hypothetical protein
MMATDRTLEELLSTAENVEGGGLFWPEALSEGEVKKIEEYVSETLGLADYGGFENKSRPDDQLSYTGQQPIPRWSPTASRPSSGHYGSRV